MNAITVCVDMSDILSITLPYNRHHWKKVLVVTSTKDEPTKKLIEDMREPGVTWHATDAFYQDGADFNKWKALEEGLDVLGREGWLTIWDCDVLWPKHATDEEFWRMSQGFLYAPRRRMCLDWPGRYWHSDNHYRSYPEETTWLSLPLHPQQREWAGYSQIFHADDPVLGPPPWHQTNWRHAGGADSMFQAKWSESRKVRPAFEVLHLGPAGRNWCGRATPYLDGTSPPDASAKVAKVRNYIRSRNPAASDPFAGEKLPSTPDRP